MSCIATQLRTATLSFTSDIVGVQILSGTLTDSNADELQATGVIYPGSTSGIELAHGGNGDYARALGLTLDGRGFGMGERIQRFAIIVDDGVASKVFVEAGGEFKVSSAEYVLAAL